MCGLIAQFGDSTAFRAALLRGLHCMHRRGPDGEGVWEENDVWLGHRRLAILDLDARASQPMQSECGRYVIAFNGEIYNFHELRNALLGRGVAFRTTSDTEVILALFAAEGASMLPKLHGMFALCIWDRHSRRGFLARDPYGIKPLYRAMTPSGVLVGSQVKALLATGLVSRDPDPDGQAGFWMLGSVPEPHTWYRDIKAIPAGHYAWVDEGHIDETICWFDIGRIWREAPREVLPDDEVQSRVRSALQASVSRHLVADVPVGLFLSGGIDSGVLAALMMEAGVDTLAGITVAYDEFAGSPQDEAPGAAAIARHYGFRHHIRRVKRAEFLLDLPRILEAMDQPSIDGINTWYASKAAAELGLRVVLSGTGGDELFQGYPSFHQLPALVDSWRAISRIPGVRALAGCVLGIVADRTGNARWRHASDWAGTMGGAWWLRRSLNAPEWLPELMGAELAREALVGFDASRRVTQMCGELSGDHRLALGQIESGTYLRNQLLRDSDWASMDHGLELRTPLVDAHLLTSLQPQLSSFRHHPGKRLLVRTPQKPLPVEISTRRKTGFGIPVARWLASEPLKGIRRKDSPAWAIQVGEAYAGPGSR